MKILYDHQMFTMQRFGGITRYFCDLMTNLPEGFEAELPVCYSENQYLKESGLTEASQISFIPNFRVRRRIYYFFNNRLSCKHLKSNDFDVFHPSYYSSYFVDKIQKPFVITVHDMTHERFKNSFLLYDRTAEQKKKLIEKAERIIAVSECTKNDIITMLNVNPDKITVVHHGFHSTSEPAGKLFDNYILYVGDRKGYKNFRLFIQAVSSLLQREKELKVVCTGADFTKKEVQYFKDLRIEKQLHHIFANESQLSSLYKHALTFVYPSLYEGFGIPILEAFHNECPICLSNSSCFPEVAGDAALYFDPKNIESIEECVDKIIHDSMLSAQLVEKGKEKLKEYSIEKMVNATCKVYSELC